MSNFIDDNTTPYLFKTADPRPITSPTTQWSKADSNAVLQALYDIRTVLQRDHLNVKQFGVTGDGVTNDTVNLQSAVAQAAGRQLYFPKGKYLFSSTLVFPNRGYHLVGDFAQRNNVNGTQLVFTGTGPALQFGTNNGHNWDVADYDGPQDHLIENLWLSHGAPDTALTSAPGAGNVYKAGAYGIWDWRCGGITLRNVGIEMFEANFVGVQSDVNSFSNLYSLYSKYGLYIGPRSDQQTIRDLYTFLCDRGVTIDRAGQTRIISSQFVFCGHSTASPIEIRQGSHGTWIAGSWFENSGSGYQGTDGQSMISVGEVAGYGAGGSVQSPGGSPTTTSVQGVEVTSPHCYNVLPGVASHKNYFASVGKCSQFRVVHPTEYIGSSLGNFGALVGLQAASSPSSTDTQIEIGGVPATMTLAQLYSNLGSGTPVLAVNASNTFNSVVLGYDTTASHTIRGAVVHSAPAGTNGWVATNSITGQTGGGNAVMQCRQTGSYDSTSGAQFPVGMLVQGLATRSAGSNTVRNTALQCQASGAQQNWALNTTAGDVQLCTTSGLVFVNTAVVGIGTAASAPASGTHQRGEVVLNVDPSAGGFVGWVCVSAGTPGTWKSFGVISP